jgi:electron transport complex protein RnfG
VKGAGEVFRITLSMTVTCALGAAVLGGVYVGTERYQKAASLRSETQAITQLLGLGAGADVLEVRQYLEAGGERVVYRARPLGEEDAPARELVFTLDGALVSRPAAAEASAGHPDLRPLGRLFLARRDGVAAGFVVEGEARGYKNRIRFLVGLTPGFEVAGVRVVEHEEDPGLGAEVATPLFQGQYAGRTADEIARIDVTRDPMPEDWRGALRQLARLPASEWRAKHGALLERERTRPVYAVTGATISSRALTLGVRSTVDHFRRRWALLEPHLGGTP